MNDRPAPPGPAEPDDPTIELASRYLDDDLSVDERAAAEGDPSVMAWVARLGGVREALRAPVEVPSERREAAIAAARAAAGLTPATDRPAVVVRAPVVDELAAARARRSGRVAKWLGAAAAVVALGVAGVAIAGNRDNSSDSNADDVELAAATASTAAAATADAASNDREDSTTDQQASRSTELSSSAGAAPEAALPSAPVLDTTTEENPDTTAGGSTEGPAASSESTAAAAETTAAAAETTAAPTAPTTTAAAGDADAPVVLADETSLQAYATTVGPAPAGTSAACPAAQPDDALLSRNVSYAGTPAVVYRNDRDHTASAYELVDCELLAFVQLPVE